jgi:hypothetical protein
MAVMRNTKGLGIVVAPAPTLGLSEAPSSRVPKYSITYLGAVILPPAGLVTVDATLAVIAGVVPTQLVGSDI